LPSLVVTDPTQTHPAPKGCPPHSTYIRTAARRRVKAHHGLSQQVLKGRGVIALQTSLCCLQCTCSDGDRTALGSRTPGRMRRDAALWVQSVSEKRKRGGMRCKWFSAHILTAWTWARTWHPRGIPRGKDQVLSLFRRCKIPTEGIVDNNVEGKVSVEFFLPLRQLRRRGHVYSACP